MAKVQVKQLAQYGVVSDIEPYELPSNAWTHANNVSFRDGGVVRIEGMLPFMSPTEGEVMSVYTKDNLLYYTTKDTVYMYNGRNNININPKKEEEPDPEVPEVLEVMETYDETVEVEPLPVSTNWTTTELSNVMVYSSDSMVPHYLPINRLNLKPLPAWDKKWRCGNVRSYKNFLLALGTHEGGTNYPQRVRWSDLAMPNSPPLDWDATSTTNSAGFNDLSDTKGKIIDGMELNDKFLLYTEDDVHEISYVAGNDIFRFRKLLEGVGLLAKGCVCKVDGKHFVVTRNDVVIHNGNSFSSVIEGKIKEQLFNEIRNSNDYNETQAIHYPAKSEVWVTYKTAGSLYYNKAAVINITSGLWTFRELPNMTAIHYGIAPRNATGFIDDQDMLIDDNQNIINEVGKDFTKAGLFMSVEGNGWVAVDEGYAHPTRKNMKCSVERHYLDFDDAELDPTSMKQVLAVYPQATGSGTLNVIIGVSDSPYELPTWSRPQRFDMKRDRKVDFRVTGRYISIRFESMDNSKWKLMGYALDVQPRGGR